MKFESKVESLPSDVWQYCFYVPYAISRTFIEGNNRRVLCKLNNHLEIQSALMPGGERGYFIVLNKQIREELDLKEGDFIQVELKKDLSEYGMEFPVELREALKLDPHGASCFETLSMGKKRNLIYLVNQSKPSETRIRRAVAIVEYLSSVNGKLDFKELNTAIRLANSQSKRK